MSLEGLLLTAGQSNLNLMVWIAINAFEYHSGRWIDILDKLIDY